MQKAKQAAIDELIYLRACRLLEARGQLNCVRDLCAQHGLSVFALNRQFKKMMGLTPRAWQRQCRLNEAAILLARTTMEVLHIAQSVGYESQQSFSRAFTRAYGRPPQAYRREFCPSLEATTRPTAAPITIKSLPNMQVWGQRYLGTYEDIPHHWQNFAERLKQFKLDDGSALYFGMTWDDPAITPPSQIRYDCLFLPQNNALNASMAGLIAMPLTAGRYACQDHHGAYIDVVAGAYTNLVRDWLPKTTWQLDLRPALEWYATPPWNQSPSDWAFEVMVPIA